ncbi:uncharacterized protein LOC116189751 [Punica granatum]|uniref:Uncharacterized protein LOC116189751 n=1 Tax=Punica granatum TaxID=22663 RepID=A0A6P8BWG0_PUNGR|nr:uncharacterized protein LOC116189751 [Punica granatum]
MVGFQRVLAEMRALSNEGTDDFLKIDPTKFCRAFITEIPKSDAVDNNICECFNSYILHARGKPIIDMLEDIRTAIMQRMAEKRDLFVCSTDALCPRIRLIVEENKERSRSCLPTHAGDWKFQVKEFGNTYVVDLPAKTCSCRKWNITDISCPHAVSCIRYVRKDIDDYVSEWLKRDVHSLAYKHLMLPLNGKNLWEMPQGDPIFPPMVKKQLGRPKKNRKKHIGEQEPEGDQVSRKGQEMRCSICHEYGHNRRTCKKNNNQPTDGKVVRQVDESQQVEMQSHVNEVSVSQQVQMQRQVEVQHPHAPASTSHQSITREVQESGTSTRAQDIRPKLQIWRKERGESSSKKKRSATKVDPSVDALIRRELSLAFKGIGVLTGENA